MHGVDEGSRGRHLRAALLVAIAAVGMAVAGTPNATGHRREDDRPVVVMGTPAGTVPSVFGQTRESIRALLGERGLGVRFGKQPSCEPAGRPIAAVPQAGTPVSKGDTITVLLAYQGPLTDCFFIVREPWQLVDFATGRGSPPRFADRVHLFLDGARAGILTNAQARRRDWGTRSALTLLDRDSKQVLQVDGSFRTPQLLVQEGTPPDWWCGIARPPQLDDREALTFAVDFTDVPRASGCPNRVSLYESAGAIDSVAVWSERAHESRAQPVPDVVGMPLSMARERITAAGHLARVERNETCEVRRGVAEQAPTPQDIEDDFEDDAGGDPRHWWTAWTVTLVVDVPSTTRDCAGLAAAARDFLAFAQGGPPPTWAPAVRQLLGHAPWATVTASAAVDPATWSLCPRVAPANCALSPLAVAGQDRQIATGESSDFGRFRDDQFCELIDRGGIPTDLLDTQRIVIYPARITSCADNWEVMLWVNDARAITAVNLLVPRSPTN
jgi:hypothetical protein